MGKYVIDEQTLQQLADAFRKDKGIADDVTLQDMINVMQNGFEYDFENELISKSIDSDGSIFNGCGYKDGVRIASNGTVQDNTVYGITGFIPYSLVERWYLMASVDKILFDVEYMQYYDENFKWLGSSIGAAGRIYNAELYNRDTDNVGTSLYFLSSPGRAQQSYDRSKVKYIRMSFYNIGGTGFIKSVGDMRMYKYKHLGNATARNFVGGVIQHILYKLRISREVLHVRV